MLRGIFILDQNGALYRLYERGIYLNDGCLPNPACHERKSPHFAIGPISARFRRQVDCIPGRGHRFE
jgi:hypothetical protein